MGPTVGGGGGVVLYLCVYVCVVEEEVSQLRNGKLRNGKPLSLNQHYQLYFLYISFAFWNIFNLPSVF